MFGVNLVGVLYLSCFAHRKLYCRDNDSCTRALCPRAGIALAYDGHAALGRELRGDAVDSPETGLSEESDCSHEPWVLYGAVVRLAGSSLSTHSRSASTENSATNATATATAVMTSTASKAGVFTFGGALLQKPIGQVSATVARTYHQ